MLIDLRGIHNKGFTLVELIVVIVLLGVLAAVALPQFTDQSARARTAALQGLQGAIQSASMLAKAAYRAEGNSSNSTVTTTTMDGQSVVVVAGSGTPTATTLGIGKALSNYSGFSLATTTTTVTTFNFSTAITNCFLTYTQGTVPTVTLTTSGC